MTQLQMAAGTRKDQDGRGVTCDGLQGLLSEELDHSVS